jgi:hypothetical protein
MRRRRDRAASRPGSPARFAGPAWLPAAFFLLVATLVPFAVGPDPRLLEQSAAGACGLPLLPLRSLPVERLIEPDRADGSLDQLFVRGIADESVAAAKIARPLARFRAAAAGERARRSASASAAVEQLPTCWRRWRSEASAWRRSPLPWPRSPPGFLARARLPASCSFPSRSRC